MLSVNSSWGCSYRMESPRYSWNIVESGAKHYNPSPTPEWNFLEVFFQVKYDKDKGYLFVWRYPRYKLVLRNKDIYQQIVVARSGTLYKEWKTSHFKIILLYLGDELA